MSQSGRGSCTLQPGSSVRHLLPLVNDLLSGDSSIDFTLVSTDGRLVNTYVTILPVLYQRN